MSSTRHAKDPAIFHPSRFASSSAFEAGLNAALVARRCSVLQDPEDRALLWWLHLLSHQSGGLNAVAEKLATDYRDQIGTEQMVKIGKRAGQTYTAADVKQIRPDIPREFRYRFPLRGETRQELRRLSVCYHRLAEQDEKERLLQENVMDLINEANKSEEVFNSARAAKAADEQAEDRKKAAKHPTTYPVAAFLDLCREAARGKRYDYDEAAQSLAKELLDLCLDPGWKLDSGRPWYFAGLIATLRDYQRQWIEAKSAGVVVTVLGKKVHEMLDYTLHSGSMTLLVGSARRGKSFAARSWCEQHAGHSRFIEVPPGNDDTSFYRAIARGLGMGNFSQYKAIELRERVESVLLTGDIVSCLDEAQRLWPEVNLRSRCGFPKRISWVMSMVNQGVPFCLLATPQFFDRQNLSDQLAGWNSAQFIGRLGDWKRLPDELSTDDLEAVAKAVLPEADSRTLRALAIYARTSARYLAAIDAIASRARYDATRAGRAEITTEDVKKAMRENIIPSDSMLVRTLQCASKTKSGRRSAPTIPEAPLREPADETLADRNPRTEPIRNGATNRIAVLVEN